MNKTDYTRFKDLKIGDYFIGAPSNGEINFDITPVYFKIKEVYIGGHENLNAYAVRYDQDAAVPDWYPVIRVKRVEGEKDKWEVVEEDNNNIDRGRE